MCPVGRFLSGLLVMIAALILRTLDIAEAISIGTNDKHSHSS